MNDKDPLSIKTETVGVFNQQIEDALVANLDAHVVDYYDDDVKMYYENTNAFKPSATMLQLKDRDDFSGTLPFEIAVRKLLFIL